MTVAVPRPLPHLLSILATATGLVAAAPGCSSHAQATAQAGVVWTVEPGNNSSATCGVNGDDTFTIGGGDPGDSTIPDQGSAKGVPVSVQCTVSGNDSSGYTVFAKADYGTLGSLTIQGHVDSTKNPQPDITGTFNDQLGLIAVLSSPNCTITYPDTSQPQGVASGRIWGYIDCPMATNGTATCDTNASFRFENCNE